MVSNKNRRKGYFQEKTRHILLFAFNMYALVYGLKNVGLNEGITLKLKGIVMENHLYASVEMSVF